MRIDQLKGLNAIEMRDLLARLNGSKRSKVDREIRREINLWFQRHAEPVAVRNVGINHSAQAN